MSKLVEVHRFRVPHELQVSESGIRRVLVIGSCLSGGLPSVIEGLSSAMKADYILFNNAAELPAQPPAPVGDYDFQMVQVPVRTLLPESTYFRVGVDSEEVYAQALETMKERLSVTLDAAMRYNVETGLETFVFNFLVPQANPLGRLLPRYDLRNPIYFFECANRFLAELVGGFANAHVLDTDLIASSIGKMYVSDDSVWQTNHASALTDADFDLDQRRLETPERVSQQYQLKTYEFIRACWAEAVAMHRTLAKVDTVKLVIVDLDDTLWRGIFAEEGAKSIEGWPLGVVEALLYLKKRGVILAIASKNDLAKIGHAFEMFGPARLQLSDFAIHRINWRPKADNILEIIEQVNVLPTSVVFIDDNPVERAAVKSAIPGIRVIGGDLYATRRILLWSAETQVASVTRESARRTDMIQAQVTRDTQRSRMSREDFLNSLGLVIRRTAITDTSHGKFARALELINKSNQFNTTGKRWSFQDCTAAFATGTVIHVFDVADKYSDYGTVVVAIVNKGEIEQFVMSCRVIGLGVENAAVAEIDRLSASRGIDTLTGRFARTAANDLCEDLYAKLGFASRDGSWIKSAEPRLPVPAHVTMESAVD